MFTLWFYSLSVSLIIYLLMASKMWLSYNRFSALKSSVFSFFKSSLSPVFLTLLFVWATRYVYLVATANIPGYTVPLMFYTYVLWHALMLWVPIMTYALFTNFKGFVSHMLPYGAPLGLMVFLPLVEIFSQLIRPLTLTIRFATNLSAGHIMMFMFSYFSLLSPILAPFLYIVLMVLLVMEVFIAFLQSYIFITLLTLYLSETL